MKTIETLKKYQVPIIITGAAFLGFIGYKLYKKRNPTDASALAKDEKDAKLKGLSLSYPLTTYQGLASTIFNSYQQRFNIFNQVDETIVLSAISKMKNDLDIVQLIKAFGKRRAPIPFGNFFTDPVTLPEWLSIGLEASEILAVNNVLVKNGITYKF